MHTAPFLSPMQLAAYERDGYLIIPNFFSRELADRLRQRAEEICQGERNEAGIFSTTEQLQHTDEWFLESGDKVRLFLEAEAEPGMPRRVNKIGHALHALDEVFAAFSMDHRLAGFAKSLGFELAVVLQSMYIFKPPRVGGEVSPHQDGTFLNTEPLSVTGFWFAVDDATLENGCLWALPGGHHEPLRERFKRNGKGGCEMETLMETPLPEEGYVPLEAKSGTLVILHGQLPHKSYPNRSEQPRNAYTLHVIEGNFNYPKDNWLQRKTPAPVWEF